MSEFLIPRSIGTPITGLYGVIAEFADAQSLLDAATKTKEAGYTQTDDPVPGAWSGPIEAGSGLSPVVVVADGTITFVSAPTFAQWIRPAS